MIADRLAIAHDDPQLSPISIFVAAGPRDKRKATLAQQLREPILGRQTQPAFTVASRLGDFRRINIRYPDLRTAPAKGISVHDASSPALAPTGPQRARIRLQNKCL